MQRSTCPLTRAPRSGRACGTRAARAQTPVNVTSLAEKDCGDMYGDVGFYLANHNMDYLCTAFPNSSDCQ